MMEIPLSKCQIAIIDDDVYISGLEGALEYCPDEIIAVKEFVIEEGDGMGDEG